MNKKYWEILGLWAMGLLLLIATIIVIRWIVDFVTWSTLDSGWAQALGSIAALGVAIFVMSRQNKHAAKLIIDSDTLALRRRTAAVRAMVERADWVSARAIDNLVATLQAQPFDTGTAQGHLEAASHAIDDILGVIKSIPAYELGSYSMAEGVIMLVYGLGALLDTITDLLEDEALRQDPDITDELQQLKIPIKNGVKQFKIDASTYT